MSPRNTTDALSPEMTLREFHNGYWYREQLKEFAQRIGIPTAATLRKDELETAIVAFLRTGKVVAPPTKRSLRRTGVKDVDRGLTLKLRIQNYTNNRETTDRSRAAVTTVTSSADFHAANHKATRTEMIAAWNELKKLDVPKDYASWEKARAKRTKNG